MLSILKTESILAVAGSAGDGEEALVFEVKDAEVCIFVTDVTQCRACMSELEGSIDIPIPMSRPVAIISARDLKLLASEIAKLGEGA